MHRFIVECTIVTVLEHTGTHVQVLHQFKMLFMDGSPSMFVSCRLRTVSRPYFHIFGVDLVEIGVVHILV